MNDSVGDAAARGQAEATTLFRKMKSKLDKVVHFKPGNPHVLLQLRKVRRKAFLDADMDVWLCLPIKISPRSHPRQLPSRAHPPTRAGALSAFALTAFALSPLALTPSRHRCARRTSIRPTLLASPDAPWFALGSHLADVLSTSVDAPRLARRTSPPARLPRRLP